MNEVMQWRLIQLCRRLWKVPILGWHLGRLEAYLYHQLILAGWEPVDFRAGYKVPNDDLVRWKPPVDPRTYGAMYMTKNPPTSRKRSGDIDS